MWAAGAARARATTMAFAALSVAHALAQPIEPAPATAPSLSPDRRLELTARRDPDALWLAALDSGPAKSAEHPSLTVEPYGRIALPAPEGELWRKWRQVKHEIRTEAMVLARCRADPGHCPSAAARFLAIIAAGQARE